MSSFGIFYGDNIIKSIQSIFEHESELCLHINGARILIKPNLVAPLPYTTGATTDPELAIEIARHAKRFGAKRVYIAESSWVGAQTNDAFKATKYAEYAQKEGIELIDIKKEPWISRSIQGEVCKSIAIPRAVAEADIIINIPVLKVHSQTVLSMGMKNLKGLIPDFEKKKFHMLGLHKAIVDLNTIIKPALTVLDCRLVDINYEFGGNPVRLNLLFWGNNTVTLDCIAASFLGYNPQEIGYLSLACSKGLGVLNYIQDKVHFVNLEDEKNFEQVQEIIKNIIIKERDHQLSSFKDTVTIFEKHACSGCRGAAYFAISQLAKENLSGFSVYMGKNHSIIPKNCFAIGNCLKNIAHEPNIVYGCPPSSTEIFAGLKKWLERKR